jgi:hypothetical protein
MSEPVKTIASCCGQYRAEILPRNGAFQVIVFHWTEEWVPGHGKVAEFWERISQFATLADTLERAEELVAEEFRARGTS